MTIIDGRKIASDILENLKKEVAALPFTPAFCDILVGDDPVSAQYVNLKARRAESVGIKFIHADLPKNTSTQKLVAEVLKLNQVDHICGLIIQLPLPAFLDTQAALDAIDPRLDVDCIGQLRTQKFYQGDLSICPPTAAAIMQIIDSLLINWEEKNILVLGQGQLVGKPTAFLLGQRGLKFTVADKNTKNADELMLRADLIISGVGKPRLITAEKIKPGCVVIDAGTAEDGGKILGDVDFESVKNKASAISPVPGGVGPVTVSMLLQNVAKVAKTLI